MACNFARLLGRSTRTDPLSQGASRCPKTIASVVPAATAATLIPRQCGKSLHGDARRSSPVLSDAGHDVVEFGHPKVYLPVEANGSAKCPYCGAQYTLAG